MDVADKCLEYDQVRLAVTGIKLLVMLLFCMCRNHTHLCIIPPCVGKATNTLLCMFKSSPELNVISITTVVRLAGALAEVMLTIEAL